MFTQGFYTRRSQKCKKYGERSSVSFTLLGTARVKAAYKTLVKYTQDDQLLSYKKVFFNLKKCNFCLLELSDYEGNKLPFKMLLKLIK